MSTPIKPEVGMGATICIGSDCYPATIIKISPSGKSIWIQHDDYKPGPKFDFYSNQNYVYRPWPNGAIDMVRLTKRGWRIGGLRGTPVGIGGRRAYQDPSF